MWGEFSGDVTPYFGLRRCLLAQPFDQSPPGAISAGRIVFVNQSLARGAVEDARGERVATAAASAVAAARTCFSAVRSEERWALFTDGARAGLAHRFLRGLDLRHGAETRR